MEENNVCLIFVIFASILYSVYCMNITRKLEDKNIMGEMSKGICEHIQSHPDTQHASQLRILDIKCAIRNTETEKAFIDGKELADAAVFNAILQRAKESSDTIITDSSLLKDKSISALYRRAGKYEVLLYKDADASIRSHLDR